MKEMGRDDIITLSRAAYTGAQRFGTLVWSGDIQSTFESLTEQIKSGLNMAMCGLPWWNTDIGGFYGGDTGTEYFRELIVRWFQYGVFCPVMRLHGTREGHDRTRNIKEPSGGENEIWSFGEKNTPILADLIALRYRLIPYISKHMKEASEHGTPVMRPMFFDFPEDPVCWTTGDQYMFGDDILFAPISVQGQTERKVWLPEGDWTLTKDRTAYRGGQWVTVHAEISEFIAFVKDVAEHPEHLADYRKIYKNVYPFSDGIFKMLMANEAKPERTVKFLNAMLGLTGDKAIKNYTLGVPENPGVLNDKTAIFDIYGTTQAGEPVLIEVQQNFNTLFVDRLIYYTARVVSRTVKKSQDYNLPHIYVLSLLTENQFPTEIDTYLHHAQLVRNRHLFYEKLDIYLVEIEKFFAIEDRTPPEKREQSDRAEMLRIFRDVLEEKEIPEEKLKKLLDKDFAKDVSLEGYTDETLLNEVDGMTDMLYEKQGSYLQAKEEVALEMLADNEPIDKIVKYSKLPEEKILQLKIQATKRPVSA